MMVNPKYPEWVDIKGRNGRAVRFKRNAVVSLHNRGGAEGEYTEVTLSTGTQLNIRRITDSEAADMTGHLLNSYEEEEDG